MFRFFQNNPQIHRLDKNTPKPPSQGGVRGAVPNGGPQSVRQRELDGLDDFEDDLSDIEGELEGGEDLEEVSIDLADEARLLLDSLWRKNQDTSKLMVCGGLDSSMHSHYSLSHSVPPLRPQAPTQGVFVQEVSGTPLALKLTRPTQEVGWTFKVTTQVCTVCHVCVCT